jgi:hypothetical protein
LLKDICIFGMPFSRFSPCLPTARESTALTGFLFFALSHLLPLVITRASVQARATEDPFFFGMPPNSSGPLTRYLE